MGTKKKKGKKGVIINFITRSRALKKLKIPLKDFRKLCILKGIYPSPPKKKLIKKYGTKARFYHIKDILHLSHEPLLKKIKEAKIYLKKIRRAINLKDDYKLNFLKIKKPEFNCNHLIRERYPTFIDAIKDLDDCLSMIHLFSILPSGSTNDLTGKRVFEWQRLRDEFQAWCVKKACIRKAFVSIKGTYVQISIHDNDVIFLIPHDFVHEIPNDIDYNVMSTFLFFYETLLKFINFRLYNEIGLYYPPRVDEELNEIGLGFNKFILEVNFKKKLIEKKKNILVYKKNKVDNLDTIIKNIPQNKIRKNQVEMFNVSFSNREITNFDKKCEKRLTQYQKENTYLFKDLFFLLSREVPQRNLEFLIQATGGQTSRFQFTSNSLAKKFTHNVVDHSIFIENYLSNREYIQPQWVFDSLNVNTLLPIKPYFPGTVCPPHLSPFIDNKKEGYMPRQTLVLEAWKKGKKYMKRSKDKIRRCLKLDDKTLEFFKKENRISILRGKRRRLMKAIQLGKFTKKKLILNLEKKRRKIRT